MESAATYDLSALKTKLRATWIAGDFAQIAKSYVAGAALPYNRFLPQKAD
jgi:hypothetical protein